MSSMLKKPGAGSFKPKAPPRRRPVPPPIARPTEETQAATIDVPAAAHQPTQGPSRDIANSSAAVEPVPLSKTSSSNTTRDRPPSQKRPPSRESGSPTRLGASRSPEATRRFLPSPKSSAAPNPISASTLFATSTDSSAPRSSITADVLATTVPKPADVLATTVPKSIGSRKGVSASPAESARATTVAEPKPIAETTSTAPHSAQTSETVPTTSSKTLVPFIEDVQRPSNGAPKAQAKPRKPAAKDTQKRKAAIATGESEVETDIEAEGPPAKRTTTIQRKKKSLANGGEAAISKRKSQRKRKPATHTEGDTEVADVIRQDNNLEAYGPDVEVVETRKVKRKRRKRFVTPENAEEIEIDPEVVTLADLTKDLKSGKRWDKHELIRNAEQERRREYQKRRFIRLGLLREGEELHNGDGSEAGTPAPESSTAAPESTPQLVESEEPPALGGGPIMRIVNGQLVLDESSTQHDRYAEADRQRGNIETKEEHEYSRRVTIRTNARRQVQTNFWPTEDTEKFYHGLRMFGTDFNMISKMFGGLRSRRQIKLKFNREERANPDGVNKCLIGEKDVAIDLTAVDGADDLEETDAIEAELARQREEREAQERAEEEEIAAEARRKREELLGKKDSVRGRKDNRHERFAEVIEENIGGVDNGAPAAQDDRGYPVARSGVGTDPNVIDETDVPPASAIRGRGFRGGARGRGGRFTGKAAHVFASGFGV